MKAFRHIFVIAIAVIMVISVYGTSLIHADLPAVPAKTTKAPEISTVSIVKTKIKATKLTYAQIKSLVWDAINKVGGINNEVHDNSTVVIKPNLVTNVTYGNPPEQIPANENGVITDYRVVKAVAELVRKYNPHGKIYVMEGSASNTVKCYQTQNYSKKYIPSVDEFIALENSCGAFGDKNSDKLVKIGLSDGLIHNEYYCNKILYNADYVISVPTLKTHWHAGITGGIKNISIGATPPNIYGESSYSSSRFNMVDHNNKDKDFALHKWIVDYFRARPANLVVNDGLQGIQNGPTPLNMTLKSCQMNMGVILTSKDAVACDTIESLAMSWDPNSIRYLKWLNGLGAGNSNVKKIETVGSELMDVRKNFDCDTSYSPNNTPVNGGNKIQTWSKPLFEIYEYNYNKSSGMFAIDADLSTKIVKLKISVDGKKTPEILERNSSGSSYAFNIGTLKKGKHAIKVFAYDRFLNYKAFSYSVSIK